MATKKKAAPKQKAAPVKKAAPAKKVAPKKKAVAKAAPAKKTVAVKAAAKKATAPKKVVAKKVAAPKKVVAKKAPAKKAAAKPVAAKKTAVKKVAEPKKRTTAIKSKMTKTQMFAEIASAADLNTKQVAAVFIELEGLLGRSIKKGGLGEFTVPGLMKVTTVKKPAKKARKGINPFTGEEQMFKAKPASIAVKVRPLKKLKEFAAS